MRRILFLDFDGVINNTAFFHAQHEARTSVLAALAVPFNARDDFDPANLAQLAELMRRMPGIEVVVSSSWRVGSTLDQLRTYLAPHVPPEAVIGKTPRDESRMRHIEIRRWLAENAPDARFLALDDDTFDMEPLGKNFLHIDRALGLTPAHVELAVRHFSAP